MAEGRRLKAEWLAIAALAIMSACGRDKPAAASSHAADSAIAAPEPDTVVGIIFMASIRPDAGGLSAIALVTARRTLVDVPEGQIGVGGYDTYAYRWIGKGQRYRLFLSGEEIGTITATPDSLEENGCAGLGGPATVDSGATFAGTATGIATNAPFARSHRVERRETTADETQLLERLAVDVLPATIPSGLREVTLLRGQAIRLSDQPQPALMARFSAQADSTREILGFLVAEWIGHAYVTTFQAVEVGTASEAPIGSELLDVLDYDGDGILDLITVNIGSDGQYYGILKRNGDRWAVVYTGGGAGC